jgi:predicted dehydrogenase
VAGIDEAEQVREAMAGYTGVSQMTFHLRFFPAVQRAKQLIDSGKLGRILQFRMGYYHASNARAEFPYKWKHSPTGGVIRDLGSHVLDMADHLVGPIDRLIADTTIAYPQRRDPKSDKMRNVPVEDVFSILVRLKNGAMGTLEGTKLATGAEDDFRFEIHGEQGAVRFSLAKADVLEFFDTTKSDKPFGGESGWLQIACSHRFEMPDTDFPSKKSTIGWARAHTACLAYFIQSVADNGQYVKPQHADLMQGYKIEQLMQTVFNSAQRQAWCNCSQ